MRREEEKLRPMSNERDCGYIVVGGLPASSSYWVGLLCKEVLCAGVCASVCVGGEVGVGVCMCV